MNIEDALREFVEQIIGESENQISEMTERECRRFLDENLDDSVGRILKPMVEECVSYSEEMMERGQRMDGLEARLEEMEAELEKPGKLKTVWLKCKAQWENTPLGQATHWVSIRLKSKKQGE